MANRVTVQGVADFRRIESGLRDVRGEMDRTSREAQSSGGRVASGFNTMRAAGGLAAFGVGAALFDMGQDAIALEDSIRSTERQFSESAGLISEAADRSAESWGLAETDFRQNAARLGASLQGLGLDSDEAADKTLTLIDRAADLAADFGGPTSQAIEAFGSLLRGERDPIERYGIAIKQVDINAEIARRGLSGLEGEQRKVAEAQVAMDLALETSAKSVGAFEESSASALKTAQANFAELQAELGKNVIPALVDAAELINKISGPVSATVEVIPKIVRGDPIVDFINRGIEDIRSFPGVEQTIGFIGRGVEDIRTGFGLFGDRGGGGEASQALENMAARWEAAGRAAFAAERQTEGWWEATEEITDGITGDTIPSVEELTARVRDLDSAYGDIIHETLGAEAALTDMDLELERAIDASSRYRSEAGELVATQAEMDAAAIDLVERFADLAAEADEAGANFGDVATKGQDLRDELVRQRDEGFITLDMFIQLNKALDDLERTRQMSIVTPSGFTVGEILNVGGFAAGGRPPVGRVSLVGERGPELFVPDRSGTIIPNHQLSGGGGGGTQTIQLVVDGQVLAQAVADANLRAGGEYQ